MIKSNANQRYATNAVTSALFKAVCHSAGTCADERDPTGKKERPRAPYHDFVVRIHFKIINFIAKFQYRFKMVRIIVLARALI